MTVRAVCYTIHKAFSEACKGKSRRGLAFPLKRRDAGDDRVNFAWQRPNFRISQILPLSERHPCAIMKIHLGRAASAAPVKEIPRITDRIASANRKTDDPRKMRFLFFRQAIKIWVLKGPCPMGGGDGGGLASFTLRWAQG